MSWVSRLLRPLGPRKQAYREPLVEYDCRTGKPSRREREAEFDALLRDLAPSVRIRYKGGNVPGRRYVAATNRVLHGYGRSPLEAYLDVVDLHLLAKNPACTTEDRAMLAEYIRSGRARRDLCGRRLQANTARRRQELQAQLNAAIAGARLGGPDAEFEERLQKVRLCFLNLQAHDNLFTIPDRPYRPEHYGAPGLE